MDEQVHIIALFKAQPDKVDALIAVLGEVAAPSRAEAGCVEYGFIQDETDPTVIIADETWRDAAAFESHLETPHFKAAFERLGGVLATEPVLHRCKRVV